MESPKLRALLTYLDDRCNSQLPGRTTVSTTISHIYDKSLGYVTESLQSAITRINFSFDLWTSKNRLAMLGLCAHFINKSDKSVTALLALPRQAGRHRGIHIAEALSSIIAKYNPLPTRLATLQLTTPAATTLVWTLLQQSMDFRRSGDGYAAAAISSNLLDKRRFLVATATLLRRLLKILRLKKLNYITGARKALSASSITLSMAYYIGRCSAKSLKVTSGSLLHRTGLNARRRYTNWSRTSLPDG